MHNRDYSLVEVLAGKEDEDDILDEGLEHYIDFVTSFTQGCDGYTFLYNLAYNPALKPVKHYYNAMTGLVHGLQSTTIFDSFYKSLVSPTRAYKETDKTVDVDYALPAINMVHIKASAEHNAARAITTANEATDLAIKALFPKFVLPTKIGSDDPEATFSSNLHHPAFETEILVDQLRKMPAADKIGVEAMAIDTDYFSQYPNFLSFKLSIAANSAVVGKSDYYDKSNFTVGDDLLSKVSGLGSHNTYNIVIPIQVKMCLKFPKDYAYWTVGANMKGRKFLPALFMQFVNTHVNYYSSDSVPTGGWPNRYLPLDIVAEQSRRDAKKYKVLATPRVNKEGFSVLQSGDIMYIPNHDNTKAYVEALNKVDEKTSFREAMRGASLIDKPLLTDWVNGFLAFGSEDADILYKDLQGARPLDNVTIARAMHAQISEPYWEGFFKTLEEKVVDALSNVSAANPQNLPAVQEDTDKHELRKHISNIRRFAAMHRDVKIWEILDPKRYNDDDEFLDIRGSLPHLFTLCRKAYDNLDKLPFGVTVRFGHYAFFCALIGVYSRATQEYISSYAKGIDDNKVVHFDHTQINSVTVPNMPTLKSFLPHQVKALFNLHLRNDQSGPPPFATLTADPGGGKTIMCLSDITMLLHAKHIRRPVVVCPGGLVKEWVTEINARSSGALKAFPLRTSTIDRLREQQNWDDEDIIAYLRQLPINVIIVTDYKFLAGNSYRNRVVPIGTRNVVRFANTELLQRVEPDYVAFDESQRAKNIDTAMSKASRQFAATSKYVRLLSGTMVGNTPRDLVGQVALFNPTILGNVRDFEENFLQDTDNGGLIAGLSANLGNKLDTAFAPYFMKIDIKKRNWAYLLPDIKEVLHTVELTERQQEFYRGLIDDAIREILKDKILKEKMNSGSEEDEAYILRKLDPHLAIAEQFINAPSENPAFSQLVGGNKSELVSPKVRLVNELLTEHFAKDKNKAIVFGYNKATSKHIFENFAFQSKAVHYTAGDESAMLRFRNDPKVTILVADEDSIAEGLNLQLASRMMRLQTLWTPGKQEQALARIFRPDPDQKYSRETGIVFDWIVTDGTMEVCKMARLVSKIIAKANVDESKNPSWKEVSSRFSNIPPMKLSLDNLRTFMWKSSLEPYYEAYGTYRAWEDKQNNYGRAEALRSVEKQLGRPVTDMSEVIKYSMVPIEHVEIAGSAKEVFTPFVEGAVPVNPYGGELRAVALVEFDAMNEDDDDDGRVVDVEAVAKGDIVYCELGVGTVKGVTSSTVKVTLGGGLGDHSFPKTMVYVFKDAKTIQTLKQTMAMKPKSLLRTPKMNSTTVSPKVQDSELIEDVLKTTPVSPKKSAPTKDAVDEEDGDDKDIIDKAIDDAGGEGDQPRYDKITIELSPSTIMGASVLYAWIYNNNEKVYYRSRGYKHIPDALYAKITHYKGIENFIELCQKKKLKISADRMAMLRTMGERMRGVGGKLNTTNKVNVSDVRNFLLSEHKKVNTDKNPNLIKPYPVVWEGDLYIFITRMTNPNAVRKLFGAKVQGATKFEYHGEVYVKFVNSKQEMLRELKDVNSEVRLTNYKSAVKDAENMRFAAKRVNKD